MLSVAQHQIDDGIYVRCSFLHDKMGLWMSRLHDTDEFLDRINENLCSSSPYQEILPNISVDLPREAFAFWVAIISKC